ncbi:MAG: hypothetical protein A3E80_05590 [Chlamydiae bacterium RIFCSPHIGHO2_12_FULL_49_9]|nr:MAG: hypothetical protein A3E80_05590 [Chlamydiae bacterium RIFCSPHIGHO2_12_FULL_49_9]
MKFLLLFLCSLLFSYEDEELRRLWASIPDITRPTFEDFRQIETYLSQGERLYLDILRTQAYRVDANTRRRLLNMLNFKFVGPNGEMPIFEIHHLNPSPQTSRRCILLFGSYNGIYEKKVRKVLQELKEADYSGDVLMRIGGFPNLENGSLKISYVPYSFKVAFLQEAKNKGYKEVLWIDTCMHPLTNLETIFSKIKRRGYFFTYAGTLQENAPNHIPEAAKALDISTNHYPFITHAHSSIIGLSMDNQKAVEFLDSWYAETENLFPNVNWFPEELSLSVVAWRLGLKADCWFGMVVCGDNELGFLKDTRPTLQFYCENVR